MGNDHVGTGALARPVERGSARSCGSSWQNRKAGSSNLKLFGMTTVRDSLLPNGIAFYPKASHNNNPLRARPVLNEGEGSPALSYAWDSAPPLGWDCSVRSAGVRYDCASPWRADQRSLAGNGCTLHIRRRIPFLFQVHRCKGTDTGSATRHASRATGRRPRFCTDKQMGGIRTSLRRHCRARSVGGPRARGAI